MDKRSLSSHVRRHYESHLLSDERLAELRPTVQPEAVQPEAAQPEALAAPGWSWRYLIAATVLLCTVATAFVLLSRPAVAVRVVREIAMNHNKALAVEFEVANVNELSKSMSKLDFQLIASRGVSERGLSLVGARYCSVQGELAAQLRLEDASGRRWTLYQCRNTQLLKTVAESSTAIDGLSVYLWHEAGLFMGLAGPGEPAH